MHHIHILDDQRGTEDAEQSAKDHDSIGALSACGHWNQENGVPLKGAPFKFSKYSIKTALVVKSSFTPYSIHLIPGAVLLNVEVGE